MTTKRWEEWDKFLQTNLKQGWQWFSTLTSHMFAPEKQNFEVQVYNHVQQGRRMFIIVDKASKLFYVQRITIPK